MTHDQVINSLINAGFNTGWVVRDSKIVLWENKKPIPDQFKEFTNLETEKSNGLTD